MLVNIINNERITYYFYDNAARKIESQTRKGHNEVISEPPNREFLACVRTGVKPDWKSTVFLASDDEKIMAKLSPFLGKMNPASLKFLVPADFNLHNKLFENLDEMNWLLLQQPERPPSLSRILGIFLLPILSNFALTFLIQYPVQIAAGAIIVGSSPLLGALIIACIGALLLLGIILTIYFFLLRDVKVGDLRLNPCPTYMYFPQPPTAEVGTSP